MKTLDAKKALWNENDMGINFMVNVLEGCNNSSKRIKALYTLVIVRGFYVCPAQFSMFEFNSVDTGKRYQLSALDNLDSLVSDISDDIERFAMMDESEESEEG